MNDMKLKVAKGKKNIIRYIIIAAIVLAGAAVSFTRYHEAVFIYLILGAFAIPDVRLNAGRNAVYDAFFPTITTIFVLYVDRLMTCVGHEFFEGQKSIFSFIIDTNMEQIQVEFLCVLVVYFLLRACCAPPKWAAAMSPLPVFLVVLTNYFVYNFRGSEFIPFDIYGTKTAMNVIGGYSLPLFLPFFFMILPYAIFIWTFLHFRIEKTRDTFVGQRLACTAAAVLSFGTLLLVADDIAYHTPIMSWGDEGTMANGYITNFSILMEQMGYKPPEGYDSKQMEALVDAKAPADAMPDEPSNIIIVLSESYTDMSIYTSVTGKYEDPIPYWHSLKENTIKGYVQAPVFGGRTPNSEAEVLTCLPTCPLPNGMIPFTMFINKPTYSLASYAKELGYDTFAMHPYLASGWSRTTAYPNLGFDDYYFIDDFDYDKSDLIREYVSDKAAYRNLLQMLEKRGDGPKFALLVTMQNHGGYDMDYDDLKVKQYLKGDAAYVPELNRFLTLEHESDLALEYFLGELAKSDEKYTVLIFGDHQPNIAVPGSMDMGAEKWVVPYIIWTNYDMPEDVYNRQFNDGYPYTSLNYLALDVLEAAGIGNSEYFDFVASLRKVIPCFGSMGYYSLEKEQWQPLRDAAGEEAEAIRLYKSLLYYEYFDR